MRCFDGGRRENGVLKEGDVIPEMLVKRGRDQRRHHSLMPRIVKEYADDAFSSLSTRLSHFLAQRVGRGGGIGFPCTSVNFVQKDHHNLYGDRFTLIID